MFKRSVSVLATPLHIWSDPKANKKIDAHQDKPPSKALTYSRGEQRGERMTESNLDFFGQGDWRKRLHQLKQELQSKPAERRPAIPEQVKAYGTELKPKRAAGSAALPRSSR